MVGPAAGFAEWLRKRLEEADADLPGEMTGLKAGAIAGRGRTGGEAARR